MAAKRGRPKKDKVKQAHLKGMEPPSIKEIDDAADNYYDVMQERVKLSKDEREAQAALQDVMVKHDLAVYEYDGKVCVLNNSKKVTVKRKEEEPPFAA